MYFKNDSSTRGRHRIHAARPFESNKVECAERAISKLTLVSKRKPSLAHTPCAEFIVIGVFDRGRIKGKNRKRGTILSFGHTTVGVSLFLLRSVVVTTAFPPQLFGISTQQGTFSQDVFGDAAVAVTGKCSWGEVGVGSARVEAVKAPPDSSTPTHG